MPVVTDVTHQPANRSLLEEEAVFSAFFLPPHKKKDAIFNLLLGPAWISACSKSRAFNFDIDLMFLSFGN